ncbi:MAG: hypothetical protein HZA79_03300 [Sphingobacteriales bacterium]|nr:hypothetical protein [Sphingobacteriales bacterium]
MLEQLMDLVKNFGKGTVVENPEIPNEQNQEVLADATKTITSGFQNVLAGGGLQNILDLFKGSNGAGSLLKNPMVTMMVGHFISKLVGKYNLSPASASNVANNLIPNVLNGVITETNNAQNPGFTLDGLIGSLTGGGGGGSQLQDLLNQFTGGTGGNNGGGGLDIQDLIGNFTRKAQDSFQPGDQSAGGGLMDMIKGFLSK